MTDVRVLVGDCRCRLLDLDPESVQTVVTSPPYWGLRDYGVPEQIGLEATPAEYIEALVDVFREVRRVLRGDGTVWLNLGDTYVGGRNGGFGPSSAITSKRNHRAARSAWVASGGTAHRNPPGLKPKDLIGIPWRVALALQTDGWWLRSEIIWHKPNPMPESVRDRPTRSHEHVFLLAKSRRYYYDGDAIRTPQKTADHPNGANKRTVWTIPQTPFTDAHFATFPVDLVRPCILAGAPPGAVVLDPFAGSGTTLQGALELGRRAIGIEASPVYAKMIEERLRGVQYPLIAEGGIANG